MLVAARDGAYGNAEKTVPVRSPLMVLPTLPRVIGTGEKVVMPVNVFALEDGVRNADVSIKVDGPLKITGNANASVQFDGAHKVVVTSAAAPTYGQAIHLAAAGLTTTAGSDPLWGYSVDLAPIAGDTGKFITLVRISN